MNKAEAKKLASLLDSIEADVVRIQHQIYRVRKELERYCGPVGFQYDNARPEAAGAIK